MLEGVFLAHITAQVETFRHRDGFIQRRGIRHAVQGEDARLGVVPGRTHEVQRAALQHQAERADRIALGAFVVDGAVAHLEPAVGQQRRMHHVSNFCGHVWSEQRLTLGEYRDPVRPAAERGRLRLIQHMAGGGELRLQRGQQPARQQRSQISRHQFVGQRGGRVQTRQRHLGRARNPMPAGRSRSTAGDGELSGKKVQITLHATLVDDELVVAQLRMQLGGGDAAAMTRHVLQHHDIAHDGFAHDGFPVCRSGQHHRTLRDTLCRLAEA